MDNLRADQIRTLLETGARASREIQLRLEVSQPTVSRLISRFGGEILTLGKGPATRYARTRDIRDLGSDFPVYKVDEDGNIHPLGHLQTLRGNQYWWVDSSEGGVLYDHLPWFIQDMRPEGFVGRAFAIRQNHGLDLPARLNEWNNDHVLIALARRGEDIIGNLIIGDESLQRYLDASREEQLVVNSGERDSLYPQLAKAAIEGDPAGSSAGGEQPKFAVMLQNGINQHVLVKFSPQTNTPEGERWADLLVCEHLAIETIREAGLRAPTTRIVETTERVFLEVSRFDRIGRNGRLPLVSLTAIDNEFLGHLDDWAATAGRLEERKMISSDDANQLRWLYSFGALIANTDMHFGNISLIYRRNKSFELAPAYDMLPMLFRPVNGTVPKKDFIPPGPKRDIMQQWDSALESALTFWQKAANDERLSNAFREICQESSAKLQAIQSGPRLVVS
ncbi:MAG: type II toxin-antitoxin system HipA family toxinoxin YjjJ [Deltaproteobacteria bacterium]|nr:MAG: type II toxin-antitoxin system HipA family toxinoxin YjjJ [Deltaproteobacteria bacterium]